MKKIILGISMILTIGLSYAGNKFAVVDKAILASFKVDFAGAKNVTWKEINGIEKATFTLGDQVISAYYQAGGELIATSRNILSNQLPLGLQIALKKQFGNFWISELFEISNEEENCYYVTLQDQNKVVVLKSGAFNEWELQKVLKKSN